MVRRLEPIDGSRTVEHLFIIIIIIIRVHTSLCLSHIQLFLCSMFKQMNSTPTLSGTASSTWFRCSWFSARVCILRGCCRSVCASRQALPHIPSPPNQSVAPDPPILKLYIKRKWIILCSVFALIANMLPSQVLFIFVTFEVKLLGYGKVLLKNKGVVFVRGSTQIRFFCH